MISGFSLVLFLLTTINNLPSDQEQSAVLQSRDISIIDINEDKSGNNSVFIINNDSDILLQVPYFNQINSLSKEIKPIIGTTACGPTALAMLLNFYGTETTLDNVIEKLPNSVYVKGKMFYNLYEGGKPFEMQSVKIKNTYKDIYYTLKSGNPIILNIQNYDGITGHALVVVGIRGYDGKSAYSLIAHDPYVSEYREFKYINQDQLEQPEGYTNYIGILDPFYLIPNNTKLSYKK